MRRQFGSSKKDEEKQQIYFSAVDGLKKLYKSKIKPIEDTYKVRCAAICKPLHVTLCMFAGGTHHLAGDLGIFLLESVYTRAYLIVVEATSCAVQVYCFHSRESQ